MQNNRQRALVFADLEIEGRRVECPRCHVPFTPHLGNLISPFQCGSCRANLSYKTNSGRTVRCPCCNFSRPMPELRTLVCPGCGVTVIHQNGDRAVKCSLCKHITTRPIVPPQDNPVPPPEVNRVPLAQVNQVVPPSEVNRVVPPPQVNPVPPAQVNQVVPPSEVDRVVPPPQVNRVVLLPRMNRRSRTATETTASSSFNPKPESSHTTIESIADSVAESVAEIVRNAVLAIARVKREAEEDNTEAKNKKIRLD
ncbi:unnamed protein product [Microthlaspi erraticum]|uniref:Zinc finger LSD1-type domain-containing protein n=1 Tax=Microthlaspi erraticum TaxID=1685480 RepID=A0A6D2HG41_9BRAS|nr:unnamed protein product [Microthlaspi erraticum]